MKKFRIAGIVVFVTMTLLLQAQDKKAQAILDEVAERTRTYSSIKIDFEYTMENKAQKINEKFQGTLVSKGDMYRIEVAEQLIISNGKTVWTYMESANEVQINEATDSNEGFSPTRFLQSWGQDFKPKLIKETTTDQQIELIPKKSSTFNKIMLLIDRQKKQIRSIQLFDGSGNTFTYLVKKFVTDQTFQDKDFTFNPVSYPGIEVIDMR